DSRDARSVELERCGGRGRVVARDRARVRRSRYGDLRGRCRSDRGARPGRLRGAQPVADGGVRRDRRGHGHRHRASRQAVRRQGARPRDAAGVAALGTVRRAGRTSRLARVAGRRRAGGGHLGPLDGLPDLRRSRAAAV
ncbi:MAG: hypothetical protein AVDCRST_MAG47-193, partial [uncultured Nocardioidaceae bacterium]